MCKHGGNIFLLQSELNISRCYPTQRERGKVIDHGVHIIESERAQRAKRTHCVLSLRFYYTRKMVPIMGRASS